MIADTDFPALAATYQRDGAVMIRQPFAAEWIDGLVAAFDEITAPETRDHYPAGINGNDGKIEISGPVGVHPFIRKWALESRVAEIFARVVGSRTARLYTDRDVGFGKRGDVETARSGSSSFHIDSSAWGLVGAHVPSVWLALTDVGEDFGPLAIKAGSHAKLPGLFLPGVTDPALPVPEGYLPFVGLRDYLAANDFETKIYPTMKGDLVILHPDVVHGSIPLRKAGYRMGFSTRWIGDDARWRVNSHTAPEVSRQPEPRPVDGDRPRDDLFPVIWSEETGNRGHLPEVAAAHIAHAPKMAMSYTEHARVEVDALPGD